MADEAETEDGEKKKKRRERLAKRAAARAADSKGGKQKKQTRVDRRKKRKAAKATAASAPDAEEKKKARLERRKQRKAEKANAPDAEEKKKARLEKREKQKAEAAVSAEEKKKARQERREKQKAAKAVASAPDAEEKKKARLERREKRKAEKAGAPDAEEKKKARLEKREKQKAAAADSAEEKKKVRQERREKQKAAKAEAASTPGADEKKKARLDRREKRKAAEAEGEAAPANKKKEKRSKKKEKAEEAAAAAKKQRLEKAEARKLRKEQKAEKAAEPKKDPPVFALQPAEEEVVASFAALDALVLSGLPKRRFVVDVNGVLFHAYFERSEYRRLFVLLGGEAPKDKKSRAHFERRAWGEMLPGSVLWIADPTLDLSEEISLGWYVGTRDQDYTAEMAKLVDRVAADLGLSRSDIVFYGGSGGGFAAMMCARFLPGANCIVINPQIDLSKFQKVHRRRLAQVFSGETDLTRVAAEHPERVSILAAYPEAKALPPMVYVQNLQDKEHFDTHYSVFCETYSVPKEGGVSENGRVLTLLFEHGAGHVHEPRPIVRPLIAQAVAFFDQFRQPKK